MSRTRLYGVLMGSDEIIEGGLISCLNNPGYQSPQSSKWAHSWGYLYPVTKAIPGYRCLRALNGHTTEVTCTWCQRESPNLSPNRRQNTKQKKKPDGKRFCFQIYVACQGGQIFGERGRRKNTAAEKDFPEKNKFIPVISLEGSPSFNRCHINLSYCH
ncbi:hypothetical protein CEXT_377701 [Caerostris extrusa]|uniref:LAGLIDADG homing endonuclease n=1 Tax=Caerostris extrusa TaxID=172846 RepID=A0AAV4S2U1_CAEEX|nr:hypothetical protein CEXT_377701 [Caerostris extrusa]